MRTHRLVDDRNVVNIWLDRFDAVEQQLLPIKDIVRDTEFHGLCGGDLLVGHVFVQSCSPTRQARVKTRPAEAGAGVAKQVMEQDGTSRSHQRMQTAAIPAPFLDALIKPFFILGPPSPLNPLAREEPRRGMVNSTKRGNLGSFRSAGSMSGAVSVGAVSVWTLQPPPPPPPPPPPLPLPQKPALSTLPARTAHESHAEVVPPARPSPGREQAAAARTLMRALERSFLRPRVQAAASGGRLWTAWLDELPQPCVEAAARMLSAHWHRSISSRVAILSRPSGMQPATLPRSLVLCMPVGGGEMPRLIGHARLKSFRDGGPADVLLESVLVAPCGRGMGLGRLLMDRVEQQVRALGFERIVLSTSDKQVRTRCVVGVKPLLCGAICAHFNTF